MKPFMVVHCDLFYMPRTDQSEKVVLIVVDSFTKWVEATLLDNAQAKTTWRAFED